MTVALIFFLFTVAVVISMKLFSRPPYGVTYYEWYVEPILVAIVWAFRRHCPDCGHKRVHAPSCLEVWRG